MKLPNPIPDLKKARIYFLIHQFYHLCNTFAVARNYQNIYFYLFIGMTTVASLGKSYQTLNTCVANNSFPQ